MPWALKRPRAGYNFLEVLVTSLVFSTIVLSLMGLWITHAQSIGRTRTRMVASFQAERQMEECLARGFQGVDGLDTSIDPIGTEVTVKTTMRGKSITVSYFMHVKVTSISPELKGIVVRVTWTENNAPKEIRLETFISRAA